MAPQFVRGRLSGRLQWRLGWVGMKGDKSLRAVECPRMHVMRAWATLQI